MRCKGTRTSRDPEGRGQVQRSRAGIPPIWAGINNVLQLRDPGVFEDEGKTYLLYSAAGERGTGIAELTIRAEGDA